MFIKNIFLQAFVGSILFVSTAFCAPGDLDSTFGTNGIVITDIASSDDHLKSVAVQANGQLVVGGSADFGGFNHSVIARYNATGQLDTGFGVNGLFVNSLYGDSESVNSILILQDGSILAGGFTLYSGSRMFSLFRVTSAGVLDTNFGVNGYSVLPVSDGSDASISSIVLQQDGKILVTGSAADSSGTYYFATARFLANGVVDTDFGNSGLILTSANVGLYDSASNISLQSSGKIIVGGSSNDAAGASGFALVRYLGDGTLDSTFGTNGIVFSYIGDAFTNASLNALLVTADDRIVATGSAVFGGASKFATVRYDSGGNFDPSFGVNGIVSSAVGIAGNDSSNTIVIQPDNKILVAGSTDDSSGFLYAAVRYINDGISDGILDTTFGTNGVVTVKVGAGTDDKVHSIALQGDGKIVLAGHSNNGIDSDFGIVRLLASVAVGGGAVAPTATTGAASLITATSATLNADVADGGADTTVSFEYGTTVSYGGSVSGGSVTSGSGSTPVNAAISSLTCGSTYHFRVVSINSAGTTNGSDATFDTSACPASAPTVTTGTATSISATDVTFNGTVSSNGASTSVTFQYGTDIGYGSIVTASQSPLAAGASGTSVSATISSLACGTTYHFRAVGINSAATTNGLDGNFTTAACQPAQFDFSGKAGSHFTLYRVEAGGTPVSIYDGVQTSYTDTAQLLPNTSYQYYVVSNLDTSQTILLTIRTPLYNGWNIISVPYDTTGISTSTFFNTPVSQVWEWVPSSNTNPDSSGNYVPVNALEPGKGYFVQSGQSDTLLTHTGIDNPTSVDVTLKPGWTMIGNIGRVNMTGIDTSWQIDGTTDLATAVSTNIIGGAVYWWNGTTYDSWNILGPVLYPVIEPWKGYWILNMDTIDHILTIQ